MRRSPLVIFSFLFLGQKNAGNARFCGSEAAW
jgi:hypothetical protein